LIIKSSEKKEKSTAELIIEVNAEEFNASISQAYRKNRNSISVPGFRKGKAPQKIVERMYGASIFHNDALDIIMPSIFEFVAKESQMRLVGQPTVTNVDLEKEEGGFDITISAGLYPEVTLGEYKGLSAPKPRVQVSDDEVDTEIEAVRQRNARYETTERPAANGDTAVIDYEGFVDGEVFEGGSGENYELVLGSGSFIPGFEDGVQGMSAGEERDLDLVFPEEYTEELAGKPVVFKVKLNEIRETILPELDDEFAIDVSEFDTFEEYKNSIREKFEKARQAEADAEFENALLDKIALTMEADIPDVMVEEQMNYALDRFARQVSAYGRDPGTYIQMTGKTPQEFRESMRESCEKQVRVTLALEKILELENIEISEEEIESGYIEYAERYGFEVDKVKENLTEEDLVQELKLKRAAKIVADNATAEEVAANSESGIIDSELTDIVTEIDEKNEEEKPVKAKQPAAKKTVKKAEAEAEVPADGIESPAADDIAAGDTVAADDVPVAEADAPVEQTAQTGGADADEAPAEKKPAARKPRKPKTEDVPSDAEDKE
jgi:trigger factor